MMTLKEKITTVMDEKTSVTESMRLLDDIDKATFEQALNDDDIQSRFDAYKMNRPVLPSSHALSDERIDEMWNTIMDRTKQNIKEPQHSPRPLFTRISEFFSKVSAKMIPGRYAMACLILLAVSSIMVSRHNTSWITNYNNGMKGNGVPQATLEYALVGPGAELIRADRPVTENDTLAFRVIAHKQGYYSIGVEYNRRIDWIVQNRFFPTGTFDIQNVYNVEGNAGHNTLILVSSESPLDTAHIHHDDIIKTMKTGSTSVSVNSISARMECRQIIVNRK